MILFGLRLRRDGRYVVGFWHSEKQDHLLLEVPAALIPELKAELVQAVEKVLIPHAKELSRIN